MENNLEKPAIGGGTPIFEKFIPIVKPSMPKLNEIDNELKDIFQTGMITNYKYVKKFEESIKQYLGVNHAICVVNGMNALMIALKALDLKGQVIVPSFTFSASAHAIKWCGLEPVFVDVDRETFNIDTERIKEAITPETCAIMPVNVFGNPCNIEEIEKIAKENGLKVLFDSAHAIGSKYKEKRIGNFGDFEAFSMTPTKTLTSVEGGIITTNNEELYKKALLFREYGKTQDYDCKVIGLSARMPEFNAIIGLHNLERLDEDIKRRTELFNLYKKELSDVPGIIFQKINENSECSIKDLSILIDKQNFGVDRDKFVEALTKENIAWRKYFYPPVHKETVYKNIKTDDSKLQNTIFISNNVVNLPFFPTMSNEDVIKICNAVKRIHLWFKK